MRIIHSLLWGFIITWFSLPVFAELQITLQPGESDTPAKIIVSNDTIVLDVDVYLIHFDLDAKAEQFLSWQLDTDKWETGLKSVSSQPLDLPVLDSHVIEFENKPCPDKHRCFLAAVAATPNHTATEFWQASSFLPLTLEAGCERFQGQQFFVSCGAGRSYGINESIAMDGGETAATSPSTTDTTTSGGTPETEKPDIFKLVDDNKLLFANSQAKRFQIIDVSDIENPRMSGWTALDANPQEIYTLNDYYILLQNDYNYRAEDGTSLTVFNEDEFGNPNSVYSMALPGRFIESRRRGELIYTVTEHYDRNKNDCLGYCGYADRSTVIISALHLDSTGKLQEVDRAELAGYYPTVAIFPNHLVIANRNPEEGNWRSTQIQLFDLSQADDPLLALPTLQVPGQVPSEFHLSVYGQQFRVVYGPENREDGSTLAIYDFTAPQMPLLGKIDKIAPGEGLFATRFEKNRAYVVTYERTDPLWVIDLSEPTQPAIVGELHIPGWSEKMFFHEDRLLAVGIDDQPGENEEIQWAWRVAVSLFNVADPTKPELINRFTPFIGEANYSWSPALDDERALLLNWTDSFAALPINSWYTENVNHLQIVSFENDQIVDAGRLSSPVQIQRSLSLAPDILAALGDQALMTLSWGNGTPEILGELELAINLTWLQLQDGKLWAAGRGDSGINRFYRYTLADLETPTERWPLPISYDGLIKNDDMAVFYDHNPLTVQVFDTKTNQLGPVQRLQKEEPLENSDSPLVSIAMFDSYWYGQAFVHNGWFYIAGQQSVQVSTDNQAFMSIPEDYYWPQWTLRSWNLADVKEEAPARQIPGQPLGFTANGELITQERAGSWQEIRLNLVALNEKSARLLQSKVVSCERGVQLQWANEAVYVVCQTGTAYYTICDDKVDIKPKSNSIAAELPPPPCVNKEDVIESTTQIIKLNPGQGFIEEESWTLPGIQALRTVEGDMALVSSHYSWWWYGSSMEEATAKGMPPHGCSVYELVAGQEPKFFSNPQECPNYMNDAWALTASKAWVPKGFEGISVFEW